MKTVSQLLLCLFLCAAQTDAQTPTPAGIGPAINLSAGYSYMNLSSPSSNNRVWLNGADVATTVDFSRHLGVRAELGYARASNVLGSGKHADVLSYLAGPVLYPTRRRHFVTYAHALIGGARVTSAIPAPGGGFFSGFANKFSWALGGGAESRISSSMALRVGVDYLHTAYFDSSGIIRGQANLRIVGSVVYYLKRGSEKGHNNTTF
jgi:opacity protein-like surface antigen